MVEAVVSVSKGFPFQLPTIGFTGLRTRTSCSDPGALFGPGFFTSKGWIRITVFLQYPNTGVLVGLGTGVFPPTGRKRLRIRYKRSDPNPNVFQINF